MRPVVRRLFRCVQTSGADKNYKPIERVWIYMPYMHNEDVADQEVGMPRQGGDYCIGVI